MSPTVDKRKRNGGSEDPFDERLKAACKHAGVKWSQTAIGDLIDLDRRRVDRWMKGTGEPRPEALFALADALKVDPRWLATGQGQMIPQRPITELRIGEAEILRGFRQAHDPLKAAMKCLALLGTEEGQKLAEAITRDAAPDEKVLAAFGLPPKIGS